MRTWGHPYPAAPRFILVQDYPLSETFDLRIYLRLYGYGPHDAKPLHVFFSLSSQEYDRRNSVLPASSHLLLIKTYAITWTSVSLLGFWRVRFRHLIHSSFHQRHTRSGQRGYPGKTQENNTSDNPGKTRHIEHYVIQETTRS
jgi:hypothetical protein